MLFLVPWLISQMSGDARVVTTPVLQTVEGIQLRVDTGKQRLSPFVKWAGGKKSLLPHLLPNVPPDLSDYYEPFLGGGALFLGICARTMGFNVPFGRYKNPRLFDSDKIRTVSYALENTRAELSSFDYKNALMSCGKADFVYLDPPYQPPSKTSSFTDYTAGGFSEKDQEDLAEEFGKLVDKGCTVLLSNSETPLTRHLYRDFEIKRVTVNRPINSAGNGRQGYNELIVSGRPR